MSYHFDQYELDMQRQELRHRGMPIKVEPLVFRVLAYLVQHRDRVVSKQELREKLWTKSRVSDETLTRCLTSVRHALGDTGQTQHFIRTMYGNGYRFVTTLEEDRTVQERSDNEPWSPAPAAISAREKRAFDITIGADFASYTSSEQETCLRAISTFLKTHGTLARHKQRRSSVKIAFGLPMEKAEAFLHWLQDLPPGVVLQQLEFMAADEERHPAHCKRASHSHPDTNAYQAAQ